MENWELAYDRWLANPPEPPMSQFHCEHCNEEFYPGDRVYYIEGENLCCECAQKWLDEQCRFVQEGECYYDA